MLMKRMIKTLIIFLSLLICTNSFAKILSFKCTKIYSRDSADVENFNNSDLMLIQIDTNKKEIHEYSDTMAEIYDKWKITKVTEYAYEADKRVDPNETGDAHFNRWTGEFHSSGGSGSTFYKYSCEPTKKLY